MIQGEHDYGSVMFAGQLCRISIHRSRQSFGRRSLNSTGAKAQPAELIDNPLMYVARCNHLHSALRRKTGRTKPDKLD